MPAKRPLVIGSTSTLEQLKRSDDLEIPINKRVEALESRIKELAEMLLAQGIEVPETLTEED